MSGAALSELHLARARVIAKLDGERLRLTHQLRRTLLAVGHALPSRFRVALQAQLTGIDVLERELLNLMQRIAEETLRDEARERREENRRLAREAVEMRSARVAASAETPC